MKRQLTYRLFYGWIIAMICMGLSCQSDKEAAEEGSSSTIEFIADLQDITDTSKGVLDRFGGIYNAIHSEQQRLYDSIRVSGKDDWNYLLEIQSFLPDSLKIKDTITNDAVVFGWHPYWMGSAFKTYQFNLMSHVAWFSYDINAETGLPNNPEVIDEWQQSGIIKMAHEADCKALLTITSHKSADNKVFLANHLQQQEKLIDYLLELLDTNDADGIDINFEQIPAGRADEFSAFVTKLSKRLKAKNADYVLSLVLPKVNWHQVYEIQKLHDSNIVDFFIVTGYDYYTRTSPTDGPVGPLKSTERIYSIEKSIFDYLKQGLTRERIVLGLPYYGALWHSEEETIYSEDKNFQEHLTYRQIKARFGDNGALAPEYDLETTMSAYYIQKNEELDIYEKCWFDDSLTLSIKYDWVKEEDLAGIAIWALGYDNSHMELWEAIANKYTRRTPQLVLVDTKQFDHSLARYIYNYRYIIGLAGIFYLAFLFLGLIIAFFDWRVRDTFFSNKTLRLVYVFAMIPIVTSIYIAWGYIQYGRVPLPNHSTSLVLGLLIGVVSSSLIFYWFGRYRKQLPLK